MTVLPRRSAQSPGQAQKIASCRLENQRKETWLQRGPARRRALDEGKISKTAGAHVDVPRSVALAQRDWDNTKSPPAESTGTRYSAGKLAATFCKGGRGQCHVREISHPPTPALACAFPSCCCWLRLARKVLYQLRGLSLLASPDILRIEMGTMEWITRGEKPDVEEG